MFPEPTVFASRLLLQFILILPEPDWVATAFCDVKSDKFAFPEPEVSISILVVLPLAFRFPDPDFVIFKLVVSVSNFTFPEPDIVTSKFSDLIESELIKFPEPEKVIWFMVSNGMVISIEEL